jgi:hypothetical protein
MLYRSTPVAGFYEGILISSVAYRITRRKIAFLLPLFLFMKRAAWCLGFFNSHLASYGHMKEAQPVMKKPRRTSY